MSWKLAGGVAAALVLGVAFARLGQDAQSGTATWDAERAAGFVAYLLLWASVVTGMCLFLRIRPGGTPLTGMLEVHRMTSALGLSFIAAHVAGLLLDPVVSFAPVDAVVPFSSSYRPLQTGLGTLAMELAVVVLASTALAGRLRYSTWRMLHYLAFPCWLLALLHGITAGSDSATSIVMALYAFTAGTVAALASIRVYGRNWAANGSDDRVLTPRGMRGSQAIEAPAEGPLPAKRHDIATPGTRPR